MSGKPGLPHVQVLPLGDREKQQELPAEADADLPDFGPGGVELGRALQEDGEAVVAWGVAPFAL